MKKRARLPSISWLRLVTTLVATLTATFNTAQANPSDWYQIEVVIFAQQNNPSANELWRDNFDANYTNNPLILGTIDTPASAWNTAADLKITNGAFQALPNTGRKLSDAAKRVKNSADLRFLSHLAWRQPVPRDQSTQPILIQTGQQFNDQFELQGTLTIRRNRYLHAQTDLYFSRFEKTKNVQPLDWTVFSGDNLEYGQREWHPKLNEASSNNLQYVRAITANIKQSRRMRSDELHYIDHPLMGMLIHISRYKTPDPAMELNPITRQDLPTERPLPDSAISPNL